MARLIGGIGSSHAPSILYAYDQGKQSDPAWQPLFQAYEPVRQWLRDERVDTVVMIYNDHLNHFSLASLPTFALGVAPSMPLARDGRGRVGLPDVPGHPALSAHLANSLVQDDFDLTICQELALDHGVMTVLPLLDDQRWHLRVIPLAINVIQEPLPSPRRCAMLGAAIGRAIRRYPGSERVVVVSTGGLSHQLHGPDFGSTHPAWDQRFLDLLEQDPRPLAEASHDDYMARGGAESVEMMMWLTMRYALGEPSASLKRIQRYYAAPMLTGYAVLALGGEDGAHAM